MNRYAVIWTDTTRGQYRGSAATLEDAIQLLRTMGPRDALSAVVKLGNKILHRETF